MEIIYFIQVLSVVLAMIRPITGNSCNSKNVMKGGGLGSFAASAVGKMGGIKAAAKSVGNSAAKGLANKAGVKAGLDGKKRLINTKLKDKIKNQFQALSGTQVPGEQLKSANAAVAMFKMIKFIVYLFSAFFVPFMPFYAATKALFKKGIPLMKEVVIPESVDYDKKILEDELEREKREKEKAATLGK